MGNVCGVGCVCVRCVCGMGGVVGCMCVVLCMFVVCVYGRGMYVYVCVYSMGVCV